MPADQFQLAGYPAIRSAAHLQRVHPRPRLGDLPAGATVPSKNSGQLAWKGPFFEEIFVYLNGTSVLEFNGVNNAKWEFLEVISPPTLLWIDGYDRGKFAWAEFDRR
jgi:hypothetical protein